jgi:hypothetical protein
MTPVNVLSFYTITNLKTTPSMISNVYVEIKGIGGDWYELSQVDPHTGRLIEGTLDKPTDVGEITFPAGFIIDKLKDRLIAPGEAVQGWMLFQFPPSYIAPADNDLQLRMVIIDTAHDKMEVPLAVRQTKGVGTLEWEIQGHKINIDLRNYQAFQYPTSP